MIGVETDVSEEWDRRLDWAGSPSAAVHAAVAHSRHADLSDSEVSVKFTSDEEVRALNAQWRGKDKPTNVLSFPMAEEAELAGAAAARRRRPRPRRLRRRGGRQGVPIETHAAHLVVHGTLICWVTTTKRARPMPRRWNKWSGGRSQHRHRRSRIR